MSLTISNAAHITAAPQGDLPTMNPLETGQDARIAREKLNLSQSDISMLMGISQSTMKRYETSSVLEPIAALAIECLLRRRAASHQSAVSPEERAERKVREQLHMAKLRAEAGLPARKMATPAEVAERQIAIAEAKRQLRLDRGTVVSIMQDRLDARDTKHRLAIVRARNRQRDDQRPKVAELHAQAASLALAAQASGVWTEYQALLDATALNIGSAKDTQFIAEYIDAARTQVVPANDPLVTLPLESET